MGATVLVIDDDGDIRSLYRRVLAKRGYRVVEAASLAEAFDQLAALPDAIVLDLDLSDGSGTVLLDALARDSLAPPVVVCSSSVFAARVGRRYHVAAVDKLALTAIGDEIDQIVGTSRRPRLSRPSSRPSVESRPSNS